MFRFQTKPQKRAYLFPAEIVEFFGANWGRFTACNSLVMSNQSSIFWAAQFILTHTQQSTINHLATNEHLEIKDQKKPSTVGWFQGSMCFCLYFCRWNAQSPINHRGLLGKSSFFMGDVKDLFGWFYYLNPRTFRKPEKSASRKYL